MKAVWRVVMTADLTAVEKVALMVDSMAVLTADWMVVMRVHSTAEMTADSKVD